MNIITKAYISQDSGSVLPSVLLTGFLLMSLLIGILGVIAFDHLLDLKRFMEKQLALACYSAAQQNEEVTASG
jgi:hypothetical protein